jgi:hypothetical protein
MIHKRLILIVFVLTLCVAVRAQTPAEPKNREEQPSGTIDGQVVNENGQPLAGAAVFVRTLSSLSNRSTITDNDGKFRVTGLERGLYLVGANSPAYTSAPTGADGPTYYRVGESARVELVRGGAITGTVTSPNGEPVISVRVRATMIRDAKGQPPKGTNFGWEQPTDDRGIYRVYGLPPGTYIVSAGGTSYFSSFYPFDSDVPTYAPSSTRDTAAEVNVRSGEDSTIDIRYRSEPGHTVSGTVKVSGLGNSNISLTKPGGFLVGQAIQFPGARGFSISGLSDGDYDLVASEIIPSTPGSLFPTQAYSEPKRITIKGADVTGIELAPKPFGSISGKLLLESSKVPECQGKRPPLLVETLVQFRRAETDVNKDDPLSQRSATGATSPDTAGAFVLRNLAPGKYQFDMKFYARYWYLKSMTGNSAGAKGQRTDVAANWTTLKFGESVSNLTVTLAEGAASIRGSVPVAEGATLPAGIVSFLVPSEPDKTDDVLRYFVTSIGADGTFTFNNLPPGKYLAITQTNVDAQIATQPKLREPEAATARAKLRRTAETKKSEIELKPCQNLADYQLKP